MLTLWLTLGRPKRSERRNVFFFVTRLLLIQPKDKRTFIIGLIFTWDVVKSILARFTIAWQRL